MIKNVKYYSQKILPLVYDDSLSYYEVLNKLSYKMNELIDYVNNNLETLLRDQLDLLFLDAMYDADTETLILQLNMKEV